MFDFYPGQVPLLVSFPHSGTWLPTEIAESMSDRGRAVPDTDWFLPRLYDIPIMDRCSRIVARGSRYLIDLNRPPDGTNLYPGQPTPELCPTRTFSGHPIYAGACPTDAEVKRRLTQYWQPYHQQIAAELNRLKAEFGHVILLDAHSIVSRVPRLFDGRLPDLNIGTGNGSSCDRSITQKILRQLATQQKNYSFVVDGRFIGGYITRHYGDPACGVHAIQLETVQSVYMNEDSAEWDPARAANFRPVLGSLLELLVAEVTEKSATQ